MDLIKEIRDAVQADLADLDLSKKSGTEIEELVRGSIEKRIGKERIRNKGTHAFPDLLIDESIGIEVKSSRSGLKGMGNSILESTRVENVKDIYILFVSVAAPNVVIIRNYNDVVSGVSITHSPRYTLDMSLSAGESFFDKLGMNYDEFRKRSDAVKVVYDHYKGQGRNSLPYWLDGLAGEREPAPPVIRFANGAQIKSVMPALFVYFPELISNNRPDKYDRATLWLLREYSLISKNIRDHFSAGGKVTVRVQGTSIQIPRVLVHLVSDKERIASILSRANHELIFDAWEMIVPMEQIIKIWLEKVLHEIGTMSSGKVAEYVCAEFSKTELFNDTYGAKILSSRTKGSEYFADKKLDR